jgi:hypothetical protein
MVNGTEVINFTLSESSTSFTLADIAFTGGTIASFSGSGTSYSVVFTPTPNSVGTGTVGVLAGKFSDAASNLNKDTYTNPATGTDVYEANNQVSLPYNTDTTPPTVIVARTASGTVGSAGEDITFTLSEASSNFTLGDIAVTGGTLGALTQSSTNPLVGQRQPGRLPLGCLRHRAREQQPGRIPVRHRHHSTHHHGCQLGHHLGQRPNRHHHLHPV